MRGGAFERPAMSAGMVFPTGTIELPTPAPGTVRRVRLILVDLCLGRPYWLGAEQVARIEPERQDSASSEWTSKLYATKPPHELPKGFDSFCLLPPSSGHPGQGLARLNGKEAYRYRVMLMNSQLAIAKYSVEFTVQVKAKELIRRVGYHRSSIFFFNLVHVARWYKILSSTTPLINAHLLLAVVSTKRNGGSGSFQH